MSQNASTVHTLHVTEHHALASGKPRQSVLKPAVQRLVLGSVRSEMAEDEWSARPAFRQ